MILKRSDYLSYLEIEGTVTEAEDKELAMLNPMIDRSIKKFCGCSLEQATFTHYLPHRSREVDLDPIVDYYDISGGRLRGASASGVAEYAQLLLTEIPVRCILEVREDYGSHGGQAATDFPDSSILVPGLDYYVDYDQLDGADENGNILGMCRSGILYRVGRAWPATMRSVKVTYIAGYTPAELSTGIASDIKHAALLALQRAYQSSGAALGKTSESLGDYSVSYGGGASSTPTRLPREATSMLQPYVGYSRFI